jgi:hypothetical protein
MSWKADNTDLGLDVSSSATQPLGLEEVWSQTLQLPSVDWFGIYEHIYICIHTYVHVYIQSYNDFIHTDARVYIYNIYIYMMYIHDYTCAFSIYLCRYIYIMCWTFDMG